MNMVSTLKMVRATAMVAILFVVLFVVTAFVAFASDGEAMVPIVDLLDNPIVLFGLGGGMIVTVLLSILKAVRIVGKDGAIPTLVANFVLSLVVVTVAGVTAGQDFGTALVAALTALLSAIGYHETVGHGLAKAVGND